MKMTWTKMPRSFRVDLMVPYSKHLENLKTVHNALALTDAAGVVADEPDFGGLAACPAAES
jgi:hypothetical protein